jgi:CRP-like cAMP-binding protein/HAMP domain-containing protein
MPVLSIRKTVPLAILVPLLSFVGLMGWFAVANGRRTVNELSSLNSRTLNAHIKEQLKDYLETPVLVNQMNADAIRMGDLNLQNAETLIRQFVAEMRLIETIDGIEFGFAQDGGVLSTFRREDRTLSIDVSNAATKFSKVSYAISREGRKAHVLNAVPNYDARQRPWYQHAIRTNRLSWTKPFPKSSHKKLLQIALVQPIYLRNSKKPIGVLSVQFLQTRISQFLQTLKVGKSGKVFIVNSAGALIASSTPEPLFKEGGVEKVQLIPAVDFQNGLIRETALSLQQQYGSLNKTPNNALHKFQVQGAVQLAQIAHYTNKHGLDWRVITVVPQKDFTADLDATTWQGVLLGLGAAIVSLSLGLFATRWLVRPILTLCQAAEQLGESEFDPESLVPIAARSDEIGQLARVFQDAFEIVHDREQSLNARVRELTDETAQLRKNETVNRLSGAASLQDLLQRSQYLRLQATQNRQTFPTLLRSISFFSQASDAELQEVVAWGREEKWAAHEVVCHEAEREDLFFIVLFGRVEVYLEKFNLSLSTLGVGSFFGEISLLLKTPRSASVRTIEPSILYVTDARGFQMLCQQYPNLAAQIDQKVRERQISLEKSKTELRDMQIPDNESALAQNFLLWSRKRLKSLFGM